jgi:hypothetical protein
MNTKDIITEGIALGAYAFKRQKPKLNEDLPKIEDLERELDRLYPTETPETAQTIDTAEKPLSTPSEEYKVATACVPCSVQHLSVSSGLLNEALRFRDEGLHSDEILDRIAKAGQELNTMERVDLAAEKIRSAPAWEKDLALDISRKSREIRHQLESIKSIDDLEEVAADAEAFYKTLNREWYRRRLANLTPKEKEQVKQKARQLVEKEVENATG